MTQSNECMFLNHSSQPNLPSEVILVIPLILVTPVTLHVATLVLIILVVQVIKLILIILVTPLVLVILPIPVTIIT